MLRICQRTRTVTGCRSSTRFARNSKSAISVELGRCAVGTVSGRAFNKGLAVASFRRFSSAKTPEHSTGSPLQVYLGMKKRGEIQSDPRQEIAMGRLDELAKRLEHYVPSRNTAPVETPAVETASGGGWFGWGKSKPAPKKKKKQAAALKLGNKSGKGLYLWGGTGTGKTFMMDLFHDVVPIESKNRIHFHAWMIDVHERLHRLQKGKSGSKESADDLVAKVAQEMMREGWLICFDEFQVTHISDAIILKRIFEVLFSRGAVVVATSNRPPEDLYLNGLNRSLFLPFIPMLKEFCDVHAIGAEVDYRLLATADDEDDRTYIYPNGPEVRAMVERKFYRICQNNVRTGAQLEAQGRKVLVRRCGKNSNVGWFEFGDLCDRALGSADYFAVARAFHTVFIVNVPALSLQERDQVRRFITLIDTLYEEHTKVVISADKDPISLFYVSDQDRATSVADEIFAWDRTVSRLMEMQSTAYVKASVRRLHGDEFMQQYAISSLNDADMAEWWRRYDADDSGGLDMEELHVLLEDLLEYSKGHRNLTDEAFDACVEGMDANHDGKVDYDEFVNFLGSYAKSTL